MRIMPRNSQTHDPYEALRFGDFRLYISSNFLLIFANQMIATAIGWELYGKTGKALDLGLAGLSTVLPFLFLGLLGGNVADRFNRRLVIVLSTSVYVLGLLGLVLASAYHDQLSSFKFFVFGFLFLVGACNAFYVPAKQAFFRELVPRTTLPNAVTWGSSAFQIAAVTGPAIWRFLLARIPYFYLFANGIFFEVLFILVILSLKLRKNTEKKAPIS